MNSIPAASKARVSEATREAQGCELSSIEGWYAISEANRIFEFDGWNRETVEAMSTSEVCSVTGVPDLRSAAVRPPLRPRQKVDGI